MLAWATALAVLLGGTCVTATTPHDVVPDGVVPEHWAELLDPDHNGTNVTVWVNGTEDCSQWSGTSEVYLTAAPIWAGLLAFWTYSVHVVHGTLRGGEETGVANDLHRMLFWVPFMQTVHSTLSVCYFQLCPWHGDLSESGVCQ